MVLLLKPTRTRVGYEAVMQAEAARLRGRLNHDTKLLVNHQIAAFAFIVAATMFGIGYAVIKEMRTQGRATRQKIDELLHPVQRMDSRDEKREREECRDRQLQ